MHNWEQLVDLVHTVFKDSTLPIDCTWNMVVLLMKGNGNYRGVGIVEVFWKTISGLINRRIGDAVRYQDTLHEFRAGRGTGTSSIEDKLLQQIIVMREEVLYDIFIYLNKSHSALDWEQCMERVGPRTDRFFNKYWEGLTIVARAGRYYGAPFKGSSRVM